MRPVAVVFGANIFLQGTFEGSVDYRLGPGLTERARVFHGENQLQGLVSGDEIVRATLVPRAARVRIPVRRGRWARSRAIDEAIAFDDMKPFGNGRSEMVDCHLW